MYVQFLLIAVLVLTITIGIVTILVARRSRALQVANVSSKYSQGHWVGVGMGLGISIGLLAGLPIGIAMDNIATGPSLGLSVGLSIGVAIGAALEQKHKNELRPLTKAELRLRSWAVIAGLVLLVLNALAVGGILLFGLSR
jgi:hypothetical protein